MGKSISSASPRLAVIGGLLDGRRMLPGNQWFDKKTQSVVDTFHPGNAVEVAAQLAGEGLSIGYFLSQTST